MLTESTNRIPTTLGHLNVRLCGKDSGPAMVFWPSLLMDGRMWRAQAAHFGDRYRIVMVDSPGHGLSDPLTRNFTLDECAHALCQILDALRIQDCILVGNSWGGMMGGVFAATYPQRTRAAILMNCSASAVGWRQKVEFLMLAALLSRLREMPGLLLRRAVIAFTGPTTEATRPEVVAQIRASVLEANPRSVHWAVRSVVPYRVDRHRQLTGIRSPVLVVAGAEDRTFPVPETKAMADSIPGSRFVVLPRIGHLAGLEAPNTVNEVIERFLGEHGQR
jgi:3-oxoadipate enol-lactonase